MNHIIFNDLTPTKVIIYKLYNVTVNIRLKIYFLFNLFNLLFNFLFNLFKCIKVKIRLTRGLNLNQGILPKSEIVRYRSLQHS